MRIRRWIKKNSDEGCFFVLSAKFVFENKKPRMDGTTSSTLKVFYIQFINNNKNIFCLLFFLKKTQKLVFDRMQQEQKKVDSHHSKE